MVKAMANKTIKSKTRDRKLTEEESQKYRAIREAVEKEKPFVLEEYRFSKQISETFARLKTERERQGLSLADIQKVTGMDRSAIANLENGKRLNPTIETLVRFAASLGG